MSIDVRCHTNLDLHPCEEWPSELTCRPVVGDIIKSSTGLELQVVRVVHSPHTKTGFYPSGSHYACRKWSLDVELHFIPSRFENISSFEKWYKRRTL